MLDRHLHTRSIRLCLDCIGDRIDQDVPKHAGKALRISQHQCSGVGCGGSWCDGKAIGVIGIALPFVLVLGKMLLEGPGIQGSISGYYHTVMREIFVGSLCAIAVFLGSYRGYERTDDVAGNVAAISALGVALFPTTPELNTNQREQFVGVLHLIFAACFFLTLAFFSLALFRKTDKIPTRQKLQRNTIYTIYGIP